MTNEAIIAYIYTSVSGDTSPTAEEAYIYLQQINTLGLTIATSNILYDNDALINTFFNDDVLSSTQKITFLYENILQRDPDEAGLEYWTNRLNTDLNESEITINFLQGALFSNELTEDDLPEDIQTLASALAAYSTEEDLIVEGAIMGTINDDVLYGSDSDDFIYALEGNDTIITYSGNNTVKSDEGDDIIYCDVGNDIIYAGAGNDTIYADEGDDVLYGNAGNDYIHGELGDDSIEGGDGNDYIYGNEGDDFIDGGAGNDVIDSGEGNNILYGGIGDDTIYIGSGTNFVDGGSGNDTIYGSEGIDEIYGGSGNDTIYSYGDSDIIDGLSGDDIIYGGIGDDLINGNEDDDSLYGGEGDDILKGESGTDNLSGGKGSDTLIGGSGNDNYIFNLLDSTSTSMDTIVDFNADEDTITLVDFGTETFISDLDVSSALTLDDAINIATSGDGSVNGIITWFHFEEYTYIIEDLSSDAVFSDSMDLVVKLQGVVDIDNSVIELN